MMFRQQRLNDSPLFNNLIGYLDMNVNTFPKAYYSASRKVKFVTIKINSNSLDDNRITVSGKVEARKIAAQHNAECWNF